jgi:hypothetical protein
VRQERVDQQKHTSHRAYQNDISSPSPPFPRSTVAQIYSAGSRTAYALYNDQDDNGKENTRVAHSKGFMAFEASQGFYMVHR